MQEFTKLFPPPKGSELSPITTERILFMKKNFILFFFCFLVVITFTIFYYNSNQNQPVLQILFDQDIYDGGDFICYNLQIENKKKQPIYFQNNSFFVEIASDQGFHAEVKIEGSQNQYELAPEGIISKNMTAYSSYEYMLASGVKNFSSCVKPTESYQPETAQIFFNGTQGLSLPAGTYQFYAEFYYYFDKNCVTKPVTVKCQKEIVIKPSATKPVEKQIIIEDRVIFYARIEKTDYKTKEVLQTWATYDWFEEGWFPYNYHYSDMPNLIWITLVDCATQKETDILGMDGLGGYNPEVYQGAYYFSPFIFSISKTGNYIIRYYFYYYMEANSELNLEIIEFPITVTENENKKEFGSKEQFQRIK